MDFHAIRAYLCGHFDCMPLTGATGPQYAFVDSTCSDCPSNRTDDNSTLEAQGTPADPKDMSLLASYSHRLKCLQRAASNSAASFIAGSRYARCAADMGYPQLLALVSAADLEEYMEELFHIDTIKILLEYAQIFAQDRKMTPYFDFCIGELGYLFDQASVAQEDLLDALEFSTIIRRNPALAADMAQWPGDYGFYEPHFGQEELEVLRSAGQVGRDIMVLPFGKGTLHLASLLIRTMGEPDTTTAVPPSPAALPPQFPSKSSPAPSIVNKDSVACSVA